MTTKLLLAPATGGKTQAAAEHIRAVLASAPLSTVWALVPDRNQGAAFQTRLAQHGALGVRVGTFGDLYAEILAGVGEPSPVTPEPVIRRLLRTAIDGAVERGQLAHYFPIRHRPGLVSVLADLFAELKRARITPEQLSRATTGRARRLEELAGLYEIYQDCLLHLGWSDHEGSGWLAVRVLETNPTAIKGFRLLVVDGFDSFNSTQVALLKLLTPRVDETLLTLTGDLVMSRLAYRRFARTLPMLRESLSPDVELLPARTNPVCALRHLEANLFERDAGRVPPGSSVTFIEAQNTALEAREALRWLKARIVRDGLRADHCAVVARDITLYRTFLREAAREFGLPLRLACGEPLAFNPAVAAILNLLALPLQNWARRPLLDVLRSPYFDLSPLGVSADNAWQFDEIARAGQVIEGADQWLEACLLAAGRDVRYLDDTREDETREPTPPSGVVAEACWRSLHAFLQHVTPPPHASLTDYAHWVEELLSERNGLRLAARISSQPDTARRDEIAVDRFTSALAALVLGESIVPRPSLLSYDEFLAELRSVVEGSVYRLDDATDPRLGYIYAASVSAVRGVCYRAVAVLGLSEGLLPSPLMEDALLSDEQRQGLVEAGLPLEPRLRSDQQTLFYEAVTRATQYLLLTRPYLADDGDSWEASPYWSATLSLFEAPVHHVRAEDIRPHADAASPVELLACCVRRRSLPGLYRELQREWEALRHCGGVLLARLDTAVDGASEGEVANLRALLAARYSPQHVWSATRLETYSACPFAFYTAYALELAERKPPELGFDAAQLGSMLHEVLERVYRETNDPLSLDDLLAALPVVAQPVFDAAPRKYGFRPTPLWETQRLELLDCLSRTLRGLADNGGQFRPTHFELQFGRTEGPPLIVESDEGPVLFHGVIDRVDVDPSGNVRVIDYKTGSAGLHANDLRAGRRLQLAIYSLAAERCLGLGHITEGFYWAIRKNEISNLKLQSFRHTSEDGREYQGASGAMDLAVEHVATFLRAIRGAVFTATPSDGCKGYCPARLFCWRYQPSSW